ncbi:fl(2)d-associated complex component [Teleopsis dalmanni]|uniref:fl(2)d-associated complex component n=1 Tax=Teleopsis dalmanni TaxID=139649 RepID=UPI0018CF0AEB|nr:fl(2)d-associated complex component [Teleopsis dalmanni]
MDKKSKEALRRYKKSRQAPSSSESSSSSESDSGSSGSTYSSSDSDRRRKRKKASSSSDERRKREKREKCKKLEAKRLDLKRKLKLKKKAAAAAAALSGHSHHPLSPSTQAKIKKLAERKHRERERMKHRADRERHHASSRSPSKITKIRITQEVKRQKSPQRVHHQLMPREKIIIQTRTRDRTPSAERDRQRHEHKIRHHDDLIRERERRERDKERAEALARCQERQRERERLAREKIRREDEDKKYGSSERSERLLPRPAERELAIAQARGYNSRERSLEAVERSRHVSKRDLAYEREREYMEAERRGLLERDELRREREYMVSRRRDLSPLGDHYTSRLRDPREMYSEEERDRSYNRSYIDETRHTRERDTWLDTRERELHDMHDHRDFREMDHDMIYTDERERITRDRERAISTRGDWKADWEMPRERTWEEPVRSGFQKRTNPNAITPSVVSAKVLQRDQRAPSEPDWDADEIKEKPDSKAEKPILREAPGFSGATTQRDVWSEHDQRDKNLIPSRTEQLDRRWQNEWRDGEEPLPRSGPGLMIHHRSERGRGFRRGGLIDHGERVPSGGGYRPHPPPLMTLPVQPPGGYHSNPRFPNKRSMTYTNPNLIKKQQAALAAAKAAAQASAVAAATTAVAAAKAAAQSAANAVTNPGILGQVSVVRPQQGSTIEEDKPEAGEIVADTDNKFNVEKVVEEKSSETVTEIATVDDKGNGELSEISDSDDDILNKTERKAKTDAENEISLKESTQSDSITEPKISQNEDTINTEEKADDEEMLDFEEISDGELEEDARHKGVGDALGVDWASLIAETKQQAGNTTPSANDQHTTAKQKWQPHRIILDIGISMRMGGEDYARRLLTESKQKLYEELGELNIKTEIKSEICAGDEDSQITMETDENTNDVVNCKPQLKPFDENNQSTLNINHMHPLAYMQVGERLSNKEKSKLISNVCGPNSRALSACQDLKIRRLLCGLPARECVMPRALPAVSDKLKRLAFAAYQRTLEVK